MPVKKSSCSNVRWKVHTSKYEFKDRETERKWKEYFKAVEDNKPLPPARRSSVVKEMLPASVYDHIANIVDLKPMTKQEREQKAAKEELFYEDSDTAVYVRAAKKSFRNQVQYPSVSSPPFSSGPPTAEEIERKHRRRLETLIGRGDSRSSGVRLTPLRFVAESAVHQVESDLEVHPPSTLSSACREEEPITFVRGAVPRKKNPFLNFIRKPESRAAASWRPPVLPVIPPGTRVIDFDKYMKGYDLTLLQKEAITTNTIVREFCSWVKTLGGVDMPQLHEDVVHELFKLEYDRPEARALCIRIRELPVVPDAVAQASKVPQKAVRRALVREIYADVRAEEKSPKLVGFGRALPYGHRYRPPKNNTRKRWLTLDTVPEDVESMQVVWDGILPLRSTRDFCKFLRDNPHLPQPAYLRRMGLLPPPGEKPVSLGIEDEIIRLDYLNRCEHQKRIIVERSDPIKG